MRGSFPRINNYMYLSELGLMRVAIDSPELRVADVDFNVSKILESIRVCAEKNCQLIVFPELCITGYTCGDLFYQTALLEKAWSSIWDIAEFASQYNIATIIGCPVRVDGKLFNCGVFLSEGNIIGIVPKTYLPATHEFYENRWFSSSQNRVSNTISIDGEEFPFGEDLLFRSAEFPECLIGIELCEDLWAPIPPSSIMAGRGANILVNLSASNDILGKSDFRKLLVKSQSAKFIAAYLYATAGPGESTTDLVFSGQSMIAENGLILAERPSFDFYSNPLITEIDLQKLNNERITNSSFSAFTPDKQFRILTFSHCNPTVEKLYRSISNTPFVSRDPSKRSIRFKELFAIQITGLAQRLRHTKSKVILGLSGGLDSTLALLVAVKAMDKLGWNRDKIIAITMPGFGTTNRTKTNAERLAELLHVQFRTISIVKAVEQHFQDIGQDPNVHDVTYENAQARERTQILMDVANKENGMVLGTGDLSELALGWCTYNADHMSMYNVNVSIPKTLVTYLVKWCADCEFSGEISDILHDICDTPISPELLPPDHNTIVQITEDKIGPYALHDFFLFNILRNEFPPKKIFILATIAFENIYSPEIILKWLKFFYRRFFSQQFKRSCLPDGPKVGTVSLSPRGDWRMPSDAHATLWLQELENINLESNN